MTQRCNQTSKYENEKQYSNSGKDLKIDNISETIDTNW